MYLKVQDKKTKKQKTPKPKNQKTSQQGLQYKYYYAKTTFPDFYAHIQVDLPPRNCYFLFSNG